MFTLLQAARFFAAFLVVLHHGSGLFSQPDYFSYLALGGIFRAGDMGVDFFFVLSGFIILHAHWNDIGHPERILPYLKKRALRIYPAYLVVFCTVLVLAFLVDNQYAANVRNPFYLLHNILLLPLQSNLVPVAWTLRHEVMFYALFAVMIWRLDAGLLVFGAWFLSSSVISGPLDPYGPVLTTPHHIEFLAGMAAAYLVRKGAIPNPGLLAALGVAGFGFCLFLGGHVYVDRMSTDGPNLMVPLALSSVMIIAGLVELERSAGLTAPAFLRYLGDGSYSLYLVHFSVLTAYAKLIRRLQLQTHAPLAALLAIGVATALVSGALFYSIVERPLTRALRRLGGRSSPRPAASVAHAPSTPMA